jgi:hypothetical protein
VQCPDSITSHPPVTIIIDGQALVSIRKPVAATTFGNLADMLCNRVNQKGRAFTKKSPHPADKRIDVNRYREMPIKSGTKSRPM